MRRGGLVLLLLFVACFEAGAITLDDAVALAKKQNPEIIIARKQLDAARGGRVEARAGYLPSVTSSGLLRKREQQEESRLRQDDYNASIRVTQSVYNGGAVRARNAIARLLEEKRELELVAVTDRVLMDLRTAYYEMLLNRSKIEVREQSVRVLGDELKAQRERFGAGTVGQLNVQRAEVSYANEQPELFDVQTRLENSYLRLNELCGITPNPKSRAPALAFVGQLEYLPQRPDLAESLGHATATRPEIRMRQIDVEIEDQQLIIDRSELRPRVEAFTGYEVYSERDPEVGSEFNHGYVVGSICNKRIAFWNRRRRMWKARASRSSWRGQISALDSGRSSRFCRRRRILPAHAPRV